MTIRVINWFKFTSAGERIDYDITHLIVVTAGVALPTVGVVMMTVTGNDTNAFVGLMFWLLFTFTQVGLFTVPTLGRIDRIRRGVEEHACEGCDAWDRQNILFGASMVAGWLIAFVIVAIWFIA